MRKRANILKIFSAFETLKSVTIGILGPLLKSRRCFKYVFVIEDRFTKLVQLVPLERIRSVDVVQAFLKNWVYKYGPL